MNRSQISTSTRTTLALAAAVAFAACDAPEHLIQPTQLAPASMSASLSSTASRDLPPLTLATPRYLSPLSSSAGLSQAASISAAAAQPDILYHGGPLILNQKVVAIYYAPDRIFANGPKPGTSGRGTSDRSLVGYYLNNLGGSDRWNINTLYYQLTGTTKQFVTDNMHYTGYWAANEGAPKGTELVDDDRMVNLIETGFSHGILKYDPETLYLIFTGKGVNLGGGYSSDNLEYCAWHSAYVRDDYSIVQVAAMPYNATFTEQSKAKNGGWCTGQDGSPNNDYGADAEVNTLTHEIEETTTDPWIWGWGGWWERKYGESSDKCAWSFGRVSGNASGYWNVEVGSKKFLVQQQWALTTPQGCLTRYDQTTQHSQTIAQAPVR